MARHDKSKRAARMALNKLNALLSHLEDEARDAGDSMQARGYAVERYVAGQTFKRLGVCVEQRVYRAPPRQQAIDASNAAKHRKLLIADEARDMRASIGW